MTAPEHDHPGVIAPPPLIYLGFLLSGTLVGMAVGEPSLGLTPEARRTLATGLVILGLAISVAAIRAFRRVGTAVQPWKPSTALADTGPYGFSRNPIYLAFAIAYLGLAIGIDSPFALFFLLPCLIVVDRFVIAREETYLTSRLGEPYVDYRRKVRRWL